MADNPTAPVTEQLPEAPPRTIISAADAKAAAAAAAIVPEEVKKLPGERQPRITAEILRDFPDSERRDAFLKTLLDAEMVREAFEMDQRAARMYALSGQFTDINGNTLEQSIATAMAKIAIGRSWGLTQADSIKHVYFTNGRPALENDVIAGKLANQGVGWDIEWHETEEQHKGKKWKRCVGCTLWLKIKDETGKMVPLLGRDGKQLSESFGEGDADHAMIWEKGKQIPLTEKWNFKSWPRDMYYWRTVSRVRKYHFPNVLRGAIMRETAIDVEFDEVQALNAAPGEAPAEPQMPEGSVAAENPALAALREQGSLLVDDDPLGANGPDAQETKPRRK